jgi:hypothetical protein
MNMFLKKKIVLIQNDMGHMETHLIKKVKKTYTAFIHYCF